MNRSIEVQILSLELDIATLQIKIATEPDIFLTEALFYDSKKYNFSDLKERMEPLYTELFDKQFALRRLRHAQNN